MRLVFDIEANGLYDKADTIWCICAKDIDTGEKLEWTIDSWRNIDKPENLQRLSPGSTITNLRLESLQEFLEENLSSSNTSELIGHHIINYDLPLLKKLTNWSPNANTKITDTLVMSRLAHPDRPRPSNYSGKGGPHSLEAWGYRVGKGKLQHEEWNVFSPDMLRRCRQDVEVNHLAYYSITSELKDFSEESIQLEHDIAKIITDQEHYGIKFDVERAKKYVDYLEKKIEDIDKELLPQLPKTLEVIGSPILRPFLKTGGYKKIVKDWMEKEYNEEYKLGSKVGHVQSPLFVAGAFQRVRIVDFDLGSTDRIKSFLLSSGWEPDSWNFSKTTGERTSPKLEGEFRGITGGLPERVRERITWRHRKSQIEGWINNVRPLDDSLPAGANPCGAPTGRMRHSTVVNIPKANTSKSTGHLIWTPSRQKVIFGTQMRSLFIPRDGYVMAGHDAAGIEFRILAHYINDSDLTYEILSGDIHAYNQHKAGLPTRDAAKTFIYALIYGAGDAKIGAIIGGDATDGANIKREYFAAIPKLEKFISSVKRAAGRGWLKGLDGRRLILRRDELGRIQRKKAPNTLLQGGAAIVMKKSCILLWDKVRQNNVIAHKVLDMHDEGQSEVWDTQSNIEQYCTLAVNSIVDAGKYFNLNIPLDGEVKVGMNLAETH